MKRVRGTAKWSQLHKTGVSIPGKHNNLLGDDDLEDDEPSQQQQPKESAQVRENIASDSQGQFSNIQTKKLSGQNSNVRVHSGLPEY